ncbi:MAG: RagB/SusD family nutrient uptake outer membrane protein [Bacteroidetes bacterium]|nr:RagB/SusD family nutrient uptake outer membrane protein [Bacteroidota bacterium]
MHTLLSNLKKWAPVIVLLWLTGSSCTKLDVKTYSVVPASSFWSNPNNIPSGKIPAYSALGNITGHSGVGNMMEITSDEMVYPTRGTDWYDGGQWARMYYHQNLPSDVDGNVDGCWQGCLQGVAKCNYVIYSLQGLPTGADPNLQSDIAEMTALRCYFYYKAMVLFGPIPYVNYTVDPNKITQIPMAAAFDSIETTLKSVLPNLKSNVDLSTYGVFTKWAGFSLLARMYLNAKYYTGTDRSADCVSMCDSIINSGNFSLEPNYFDCFYGVNNQSKENIFVVPASTNNLIYSNGIVQASIEFNSSLTFGIPCCNFGNNGASSTRDFYQYFDTNSTYSYNAVQINGRMVHNKLRTFNDQRTGQYLIGQQFQGDGVTNYPPSKNWVVDNDDVCCTYDGNSSTQTTTKIGDDYNSLLSPVVYYDTMAEFSFGTSPAYFRHAGVRNIKYWPQPGLPANNNMANAWSVFRLADIILMRGEAKYWLGDNAGALTDFNTIRTRAYYGSTAHNWTTADLTPDNILQERGRELAWEDVRRIDQIRMETYTNIPYYTRARNWPPKPADPDKHTFLLPVPLNEINTSPGLKQNPGY